MRHYILGKERAQALMAHPDGNLPAHMLLDMSTILQKALTIGMSTQMHQQTELVLKELSHVVVGTIPGGLIPFSSDPLPSGTLTC